jgi:hypothetical protein
MSLEKRKIVYRAMFCFLPHFNSNSSLVIGIRDLHFTHLRILLCFEYLQMWASLF